MNAVNSTITLIFVTGLWHHSYMVAGDITTQSKQGRLDTSRLSMYKLKLTGRNLGRVYNSKLRHASVYSMQLHT
jgi:hypothetical protein